MLNTERLVLRPQEVRDAEMIRTLWVERDTRVPPHRQIDAQGRPTREEIVDSILSEAQPRLLTAELRGSGKAIGYCGLVDTDVLGCQDKEIAFELLEEAHGNGYAPEAARAVITWAAESGHKRLVATVWDWNTASRRVLSKLGFVETETPGQTSSHGRTIVTIKEDLSA